MAITTDEVMSLQTLPKATIESLLSLAEKAEEIGSLAEKAEEIGSLAENSEAILALLETPSEPTEETTSDGEG